METTGSDLETNQIIEIGAVVTDMQLRELSAREYVLPITMKVEMSPVVIDMHTRNGLLDDCRKSDLRLHDVDAEIAAWINSYTGTNHIALAGSGVTHFDRQFIRRDMPLTNARLTYWALDVGSTRRQYEMLAGGKDWPSDNKTHRALGDVLFHIDEMRFVVDKLRKSMVK